MKNVINPLHTNVLKDIINYLNPKFRIDITHCISHVLFYILRHLSPYLID